MLDGEESCKIWWQLVLVYSSAISILCVVTKELDAGIVRRTLRSTMIVVLPVSSKYRCNGDIEWQKPRRIGNHKPSEMNIMVFGKASFHLSSEGGLRNVNLGTTMCVKQRNPNAM
jgi:hypothetical protein